MDIQGFHHVAVYVRDLERTAAFYREVLGLAELTRHFHPDGSLRSIWLAVDGAGRSFLALEVHPSSVGSPDDDDGWAMVALRIAPSARARILDGLRERGVEVVHQTRWTLYIRDPEGNRIGLSHHPEAPRP